MNLRIERPVLPACAAWYVPGQKVLDSDSLSTLVMQKWLWWYFKRNLKEISIYSSMYNVESITLTHSVSEGTYRTPI